MVEASGTDGRIVETRKGGFHVNASTVAENFLDAVMAEARAKHKTDYKPEDNIYAIAFGILSGRLRMMAVGNPVLRQQMLSSTACIYERLGRETDDTENHTGG